MENIKMNLSDLKKSVSDMSTEELMETFRTIRHSRANPPVRKTKAKKTSKKPTKRSINDMIDSMSPEQLDDLINKLGG
jgi:hypothetical protein